MGQPATIPASEYEHPCWHVHDEDGRCLCQDCRAPLGPEDSDFCQSCRKAIAERLAPHREYPGALAVGSHTSLFGREAD